MVKMCMLVRKEDGYSPQRGELKAGEVWESLHTGKGKCFTKTKLKNRWNYKLKEVLGMGV